jgi:hypothetical protein
MKTCTRCCVEQPFENFSTRMASPDNLAHECRKCRYTVKTARRELLKTRTDEEIDAAAVARGPRKCTQCLEIKPPDGFPRDRGRPDGRGQYCKPCAAKRSDKRRRVTHPEVFAIQRKASYRKNRDTYRRYKLKVNFGITLEQYREMFALQDGKCAICRQPEASLMGDKPMELAVDHDHETGEVRALLCGNCNKGLGNFKDSPERLLSAIDYLRSHRLRAVQ